MKKGQLVISEWRDKSEEEKHFLLYKCWTNKCFNNYSNMEKIGGNTT